MSVSKASAADIWKYDLGRRAPGGLILEVPGEKAIFAGHRSSQDGVKAVFGWMQGPIEFLLRDTAISFKTSDVLVVHSSIMKNYWHKKHGHPI